MSKILIIILTSNLGGECGKQAGYIKPFESLDTKGLAKELKTRGCDVSGTTKKALATSLKNNLKGVQRVPSLLLTNPTESLESLNIENYHILDCEPLHDLKGHLHNIIGELPNKLEEPLSGEVKAIIECDLNSKETKRGGDYRLTCIHLLALLRKRETPSKIRQLFETAVEISEIMYAQENKRSPKLILKFYNATWLHFELCKELFHSPKAVSLRRMFGIYLHSITVHAPTQYEIVNIKSTNTEHEERHFGQAKDLAHRASNRQPNTIVPTILLRIQAKQLKGALYTLYKQLCTRVAKAAEELYKNTQGMANTTVTNEFLTSRMCSWQQHLSRISSFLKHGPGIWWHKVDGGYEFHDGSTEHDYRNGPSLLHCRDTTTQEIQKKQRTAWKEICDSKTEIPITFVTIFQENGDFSERITYEDELNIEDVIQNKHMEMEKDHTTQVHDEDELNIEDVIQNEHMEIEKDHTTQTNESSGDIVIPELKEVSQPTFKTKLGGAVFRALGNSSLVKELDEQRHQMKQTTCLPTCTSTTYKKQYH